MQPLLFVVFVLMMHTLPVHARDAAKVPAKVVSVKPPPYELITFVTEGKAYGPVSETVRGRYHRLVVLSGGIVYNHPTLRLETLTYGDEGCCIRLLAAQELPMESLRENGFALPKATTAEFVFNRCKRLAAAS
jgi:hypothetical protein